MRFNTLLSFMLLIALCLGGATLLGCGSSPSDGDAGGAGSGGKAGAGGQTGKGGSGGDGVCVPATCESAEANCGWISDGCGNVLECGVCTDGTECGYAVPNRCGSCEPATCDGLGTAKNAACGIHDDECGSTLDCGGCGESQVCGDGQSNICVSAEDESEVRPECKTAQEACVDAGISCGAASDGCGGLIECGRCNAPDICGGGGTPGQCGSAPTCQPRSCAELGFNCGMAVDGCGNVIDCGPLDCGAGKICGGGGANKCGLGGSGNGDFCTDGITTVTGTVRSPRGAAGDPLYGALVYIPKSAADIPAFTDTVACERCEAQVPPKAIAHAVTGPDGTFTLTEVPSGTQPLVIQLGRWRRKIDIEVQPCVDNVLTAEQSRLAKRQHEGSPYDNIPRIAVSTGQVDALECVLRKMGVEDGQFSDPTGNGRIHFYRGSHSAGARYSSNTPSESALVSDVNTLKGYDVVLLGCQGSETSRTEADTRRLMEYTDAGGRIFATHFSRDWLRYHEPFSGTVVWTGSTQGMDSAVGRVDTSFQKGRDFAAWLRLVGASSSTGGNTNITIQEARQSISGVNSAQSWITLPNNNNYVQHITFNTPVGSATNQQCGRVVFSDFHVSTGSHNNKTFPAECGSGMQLTAQEKVLEFMLFDLAACIQSEDPPPPVCVPRDCSDQDLQCGRASDGCGGLLECGTCGGGLTCGGGGERGRCGSPQCSNALTCEDLGQQCGLAGDGCGGIINCGACAPGQLCGTGGPGICGTPQCAPKTCQSLGKTCGTASDGCGGLLDCGCCPGECGEDPR